jgi:hypothetical protein
VTTEEWLVHRFKLFEEYCLPSVLNQSNKQFHWCLLLDLHTHPKYKRRIEKLVSAHSNIHLGYIGRGYLFGNYFINYIKNNLDASDTFILTTRLDNDDMIHREFVETVQRLFMPAEGAIIDLESGYQIDIRSGHIRVYDQKFNHFISLIESVNHFKTVWNQKHKYWSDAQHVIQYSDSRLWVEIIHENNYANDLRRKFKRTLDFNNSDFGLKSNHFIYENQSDVMRNNLLLKIRNWAATILKKSK